MKHRFILDNEELRTYKCYTCGRSIYDSDIQLESMREDCIDSRPPPSRQIKNRMQILAAILPLLVIDYAPIMRVNRKKHDFELVNGTAKCKNCGQEMDLANFDRFIDESCEGKLNTKENKAQ